MAQQDETDRKLIAELRRDGRASITTLSHRLQITRGTVRARLERMQQDGTIRRFTIITSMEEDAGGVRAVMMVELQGRLSRSVIRALRALPEIIELYSTNGAWDLVAEIRTETLRDFDRVLSEIRAIPGVLNSETSLLLDRVHA